MVASGLPGTPPSYRRQPLWYVAAVIRAAQRAHVPAPEWLLRGLLGALLVAVALWLIPDKGSDGQVIAIGTPALFAGGWISGWRTAWAAVPAGAWLMLRTYSATDCADCGGGGEESSGELLNFVFATALFAGLGVLGSLAGLVTLRGRLPAPSIVQAATIAVLVITFIVMVTLRSAENSSANGDVVFERLGTRFREGDLVAEPARAVTRASAGLNGETPLWLGERVGPFNLATVQTAPNPVLVYGKCGPAPCTSPVTVMHRWTCGTPPEVEFARSPVETRSDGVVVVRSATGGDERAGVTKAVIWTGHLEVTVYAQAEAANANDLVQQLRRLDGQPLAPAAAGC